MQSDLKSKDDETKEYSSYRSKRKEEKKISLNKEVSEAMKAAERRLDQAGEIIASQKRQIEKQRLNLANAERETTTLREKLEVGNKN